MATVTTTCVQVSITLSEEEAQQLAAVLGGTCGSELQGLFYQLVKQFPQEENPWFFDGRYINRKEHLT